MVNVKYVHSSGSVTELEVPAGTSVMQAAVNHGLDGIVGECGGAAMCATCHVYVDPDWLGRLQPMSDHEDELLDGTVAERRPESRLSCQIELTEALDGLTVATPDRQV